MSMFDARLDFPPGCCAIGGFTGFCWAEMVQMGATTATHDHAGL